jgi:hypothetical protein
VCVLFDIIKVSFENFSFYFKYFLKRNAMSEKIVQLKIKNPSTKSKEFECEFPLNSTVLDLKQYLELVKCFEK